MAAASSRWAATRWVSGLVGSLIGFSSASGIELIIRSLRGRPSLALGDARRHQRLRDLAGAAVRARQQVPLLLLVEGVAAREPGLELVALLALEPVADHEASFARSASACTTWNGRSCWSEGTRERASCTRLEFDIGDDDCRMNAVGLRQHLAPGRDDKAVAVGLPPALVPAGLRRREHEAAVLDGARPHQHMPMRRAGRPREGRGNREEVGPGLGQRPVEMREAQVVADRDAERAPRQIGQHRHVARLIVLGLAVALAARQVDVEHMDLVEARLDLAAGREQQRPVGDLAAWQQHRHRPDVQPDAELAGKAAEMGDGRVPLLRPHRREQARALRLHQRRDLGRLHVLGTLPGGLADQLAGLRQVPLHAAARAHLHEARAELTGLTL